MQKIKSLVLFLTLFYMAAATAFIIDYDAINDDDHAYALTDGTVNYSIDGYFREDGSKIYVHQDKRPVTVENEHSENSGLKLEGVNKQDLESLHHGAELYDKMMPKKD